MVYWILHKVQSWAHLVDQRHVQNAGADKATEKHWCVGQRNDVLIVLTVVKDLIEHHHDQSELKQESQENVHEDV